MANLHKLTHRISHSAGIVVDFLKEEDLVKEAVIVSVVLVLLIFMA